MNTETLDTLKTQHGMSDADIERLQVKARIFADTVERYKTDHLIYPKRYIITKSFNGQLNFLPDTLTMETALECCGVHTYMSANGGRYFYTDKHLQQYGLDTIVADIEEQIFNEKNAK